jgi:methylated-DNA-[protein]-cysteine S-methyltransferase
MKIINIEESEDRPINLIETPIGDLHMVEQEDTLIELSFTHENKQKSKRLSTSLSKELQRQMNAYFKGKLKSFDISLGPKGTEFQKRVWNELLEISYGESQTYGEIAKKINNPKGQRAVGMANNKNPIPIIIPCHRVLGQNLKLVGYAGGLSVKKELLNLEGILFNDI